MGRRFALEVHARSWRPGMAAAQPYGCSCCLAHCPAAFRFFAHIVFARIERVLHGPAQRTMDEWPTRARPERWDVRATAALDGGGPPSVAVHTLLAGP